MKRFQLFLMALLASCGMAMAQTAPTAEGGTIFLDNVPFADALAKAKADGKQLFVDCYTTWCGPCKMMTNKVFPQAEVGEFMNQHFVCLKVDMEKGEGPELAKRYEVAAYPTMLILKDDGTEVNRIVGALPGKEFVERVKKDMQGSQLPELQAKWDGGDHSADTFRALLDELMTRNKRTEAQQLCRQMLDGHGDDIASDPLLLEALQYSRLTPDDPAFIATWKQRELAQQTESSMNEYFEQVWENYPLSAIQQQSQSAMTFDPARLDECAKVMQANNVPDAEALVASANVIGHAAAGNWKDYAKLAKKYCKKYGYDDRTLLFSGQFVGKNCQDSGVRKQTADLLRERVNIFDAEEQAKAKDLSEGAVPAVSLIKSALQKYIAELEK